MRLILFFITLVLPLLAADQISFDQDWRFIQEDEPQAERVGLDDSKWRSLDVPHDWAFESDYAANAAQGGQGGYKPGGIGWYRKSFTPPAGWQEKRVLISFDGVYMNSEVWINGKPLGKRPYGYISFQYDLSPHLIDGENVLAVRVDNSREPSARWYHGCGIYGHVNLLMTDPVYIPTDGVYLTTPEISDTSASVMVQTEIASQLSDAAKVSLSTVILDPDGKQVAEVSEQVEVSKQGTITQSLTIPNPKRWDIDTPHLYKVITSIQSGDHQDEVMNRLGIREIRWEKETGFWLNGRVVKIKGVADHSEAGPIGAAWSDELLRWKLQQLKDMGCNSIRTAHNPQTPIFYNLCDEMGILVMDEIFDGWNQKAPQDYGKQAFDQWWERDLRAWLRRDRNHPCVIIWSLGNETGGAIAKEMVKVCHELDPTRLTTSGHASPNLVDVEGVNGMSEFTYFFHKAPHKAFVATEAPHTWQVRGYYRTQTWFRDGMKRGVFPCPNLTEKEVFTYDWTPPSGRKNKKQIFNSSYDNAIVRITARKNWELMRDLPWHSGHYRWTGIDYLGEASYVHGGWPFRAFMGGVLDLALLPKDLYYFYQSQWTTEPMVHILPHWTHPKMAAGTEIPVWVYSNCDEVELFLNGESLGKDQPGTTWDEMQCDWMVPWAPGTIEAVGYKDGKEVTRTSHTTAGVPAQISLKREGDLYPILTVKQQDQHGVMNPYAENRIHYHLDGPARILSLEGGNPVNTENNYGKTSRHAFFGLTRAFFEISAQDAPVSVTVGAICGEKQLMTSDLISIDVKQLALQGNAKKTALRILYSTDGSQPSIPYSEAFPVSPNTTVNAHVYSGDQLLLEMAETFGPKEGIYWADGTEDVPDYGGDQAEETQFHNAIISTQGKGFQGKGYLDFHANKGAYVEWYQENDGGATPAKLSIRYSGKRPTAQGRPMQLSVNGKKQKLFFQNTAGYGTDWATHDVQIQLQPGANKIRLTTIEEGGMCIDAISVE